MKASTILRTLMTRSTVHTRKLTLGLRLPSNLVSVSRSLKLTKIWRGSLRSMGDKANLQVRKVTQVCRPSAAPIPQLGVLMTSRTKIAMSHDRELTANSTLTSTANSRPLTSVKLTRMRFSSNSRSLKGTTLHLSAIILS